MSQKKQNDWYFQWQNYHDNSLFLFKEWIYPNTLEDFRDKTVLDAGCGGGQHTFFVAPFAKSVTAVDLNTVELAKRINKDFGNIEYVESDLATMNLEKTCDIVFCIGVVQHTDDPEKTVSNLKKHLHSGSKIILWVYSHEGNFLNRVVLEFLKRHLLLKLPKNILNFLAIILTFFVSIPVYTIYLLPLRFLPYDQYFENWRKLSFRRNLINVFDKLNAPQTIFIHRNEVEQWLDQREFKDVFIDHYKKVSWRASGTKI